MCGGVYETCLGAVTSASEWVWRHGRGGLLDDAGDGNNDSFGSEICSLSLSDAGAGPVCCGCLASFYQKAVEH